MQGRMLKLTKMYFDYMEKHPKTDKWIFGLSLAIAANMATHYLTIDPTEKTIERFEKEIDRLNSERVAHLKMIEALVVAKDKVKDQKNKEIFYYAMEHEKCLMALSGSVSDLRNSWCFHRVHTNLAKNERISCEASNQVD